MLKRWLLLVLCVVASALVLSCLKTKNWRLYVRVGRGQIEGYPDGSMLAYFSAIREPDGAVPDSGAAAYVSWEGINNAVRLVQGSVPYYSGWLYHTDFRVFPATEIATAFGPPTGDSVRDRRDYAGTEPLLAYPALTADTAAGQVIVSVGAVSGALSYLMRVTEGDDPLSPSIWRTTNIGAPFTDTIPAGTLVSGRAYRLWGVVANIDLPALRANPEQLPTLPASFAHSEGRGPGFTAP